MSGMSGMSRMSGMMGSCLMESLMMAFLQAIVVGAAFLLFWFIRYLSHQTTDAAHSSPNTISPDTLLAILQRRYAKGEIGADEYERIRSDLLHG